MTDALASSRHLPRAGTLRKSPGLLLVTLLLWLIALWLFGGRLRTIVENGGGAPQMLVFGSLCAILLLFWLIAVYSLVTVAFAASAPGLRMPPANEPDAPFPRVALLYTICDDFCREAALSAVSQDYSGFHVFLLDDSGDPAVKRSVDDFHATYPDLTTLVRRGSHDGFKAGNLNSALQGPAAGYERFAIADADEVLPRDFLARTARELSRTGVAFAQARHSPKPRPESAFADDLGPSARALWDVFCRPKNRYGFVACLGHGTLVRRSAWEAVGRFPLLLSEDLAFSMRLAREGWQGLYLPDVVCHEAFPPTYAAFKRRQERYVVGATQALRCNLLPLLLTTRLSWTEKIDALLWTAPLYVPALCLLFLLLAVIGALFTGAGWRAYILEFGSLAVVTPPVLLGSEAIGRLLSWDFQLWCFLCSLAPAFPCVALALDGQKRVVRLLALSFVPYMSVMVASWRGLLHYWVWGRTSFEPTNRTSLPARGRCWRSPIRTELSLGAVIAGVSMMWMNLALAALGGCLLLGVAIERLGWSNRTVRFLCVAAFLLTLLHYAGVLGQPVVRAWTEAGL